MALTWKVIGVLIALSYVRALPASESAEARSLNSKNSIQTESDLLESVYTDCLRKDSMSCVKYKIFSFVDKMIGQKDSISLTDGVSLVKTSSPDGGEGAPRALNEEGSSFESLVLNRAQRFLESHTLKVDLKGKDVVNAVQSTGRAIEEFVDNLTPEEEDTSAVGEESRGKKKKAQKIIGPIVAAVAMKIALLIPLALGAIALIAGKALLIGKIALVISAIIGLKKLLSHQKHVTYEVVSHPHHTSSHEYSSGGDASGGYSGGSGGWGRSIDAAQSMAYSAQIPQAATLTQ